MVYSLVNSADNSAYSGSWLSIDATTGKVTVNGDQFGTASVKVKYTYNGGSPAYTNAFTVTVSCNAHTAISPSTSQNTIPTPADTSAFQILARTGYVTIPYSSGSCALSGYAIYTWDGSSATSYSGSWLTLDASGNLKVDRNTRGAQTIKIKYTYGGNDIYSSSFVVNVACPVLSQPSFSPTTYTH